MLNEAVKVAGAETEVRAVSQAMKKSDAIRRRFGANLEVVSRLHSVHAYAGDVFVDIVLLQQIAQRAVHGCLVRSITAAARRRTQAGHAR